jgi:hypothetical protein
MANEWYVQHGGKEHGPLTSTTLKKLATEGKITPATSVRLGAQGAWGPASRVQGLFGSTQSPAVKSAAAPNPAALATPAAKPAAPAAKPKAPAPKPAQAEQDDPFFDLPPPAPPVANPIPRVPVAAAVPLPRAVPTDGGSITPKIIGGVAVILGTVALATCWLPMMGGLIGWTGIAMGGLGLITGVIGLALAAQHKGSGLMLNISGTSSAAVGLVMSVVLGVVHGMFTSAPAPMPTPPAVVAKVTPTPAIPTPIKQPELPPEPVWTDASQPIQQGDIKAQIVSIKIEQLRLEDITTMKRGKPQPMLKIKVALENTSQDKIVEFPGWIGGGEMVGQGLGQLVAGEAGGALAQLAGSGAILADNVGNKYKQTPISLVFGGALTINQDNSIRPGKVAEKELLFAPPLETIEYLRLELPPAGFSGTDSLRFQIPKAMVAGLASESPAGQVTP